MTVEQKLLSHYLGIAPATREEGVLQLLLETAVHMVGADSGSVLAYDEAANDLRFVMMSGDGPSPLLGQRVPIGSGLTGLAALTHEVQIGAPTFRVVDDMNRPTGAEGEPQAVLAAPMVSGDTLVGVLTAVRFTPGQRFTTDDGRAYGNFATVAALLLDQHHRLKTLAGETGMATTSGYGDDEARIRQVVEEVARRRPDRLPKLAALIEQIAALSL